jgi:hypothetical protein
VIHRVQALPFPEGQNESICRASVHARVHRHAGALPRAQSGVRNADVKRDYRPVRDYFIRAAEQMPEATTASSRLLRFAASVGRSLLSPTISTTCARRLEARRARLSEGLAPPLKPTILNVAATTAFADTHSGPSDLPAVIDAATRSGSSGRDTRCADDTAISGAQSIRLE